MDLHLPATRNNIRAYLVEKLWKDGLDVTAVDKDNVIAISDAETDEVIQKVGFQLCKPTDISFGKVDPDFILKTAKLPMVTESGMNLYEWLANADGALSAFVDFLRAQKEEKKRVRAPDLTEFDSRIEYHRSQIAIHEAAIEELTTERKKAEAAIAEIKETDFFSMTKEELDNLVVEYSKRGEEARLFADPRFNKAKRRADMKAIADLVCNK